MGIGPDATAVGDEIAVFFGARSPFVITALGDGGHALVGDAFVLGMMHGEVRAMEERNELQAKTVILR